MNKEKILKKILIITPFFAPNVGGVETRFTDICNYLSRNGYYIYVLTYQPLINMAKGLPFEQKENMEIRRIQWFGRNLFHKLLPYHLLEVLYLVPWLLLKSFIFVLRKKKDIDVIHTPGLNASVIGMCLKFFTGKRFVMSTHTVYRFKNAGWLLRKFLKNIVGSADRIIAISNRSKAELLSWGAKEDKIIVHTTWVNHNIFKPLNKIKCREMIQWDQQRFIILFVGRLFRHKGTELFVAAATELSEKHNDMVFVVVGEGEEDARLNKISKTLPGFRYAGYVQNEKLPLYYSASDLFVMPSIEIEPFGRVAVEALSCGLPVLARKNSGFFDIADLTVARAIEPNISSIKKEILFLYHDRNALHNMSLNALKFSKEHFSENNVQSLLKAYEM